jgi:hypothetical protein
MKKIALIAILFVTVHLAACTPRPDEMPAGDSTRSEIVSDNVPDQDSLRGARRQSDPSRENYILPMDTIHISQARESTVLNIGGPLGDGCQRFEFVDSVKEGSTLKLTFWASRPKAKDVVCTQQMQYVQREIRLPKSAYTQLSVVQPNGKPPMTRSLSER